MPHIVLDTETTGTDPRRDKIVEIGAINLETRATFHCYANPGIPVPADAAAIHGLTDEFLAQHPPLDPAPFLAFIGDATLVAHNAPFDVSFLNAELAYAGLQPLPNPVVDTLALARQRHPLANNALDGLCRRYGISTARRTKHSALLDAELLADVYAELIGRQATLELTVAVNSPQPVTVKPRLAPLPPRITIADIAAHKAMIATIPDAIWRYSHQSYWSDQSALESQSDS